jgi:hypothetical protein
MKRALNAVSSALCVLVAGCGGSGGGGNGGGPAITMSFSPAALSASFKQGDPITGLPVAVAITHATNQQVFVLIEEPEAVLDPVQTSISLSPDGNSATAIVWPSCSLSPGVHSGAFTVAVCTDSSCTSRLSTSGNTLPYTFTVSPGALITAKVDGVAQPGFSAHCGGQLILHAKVGQTVELTSAAPVTWSSAIAGTNAFPTVTGAAQSATTWTATLGIDNPSAVPANTLFGSLNVSATPTDGSGGLFVLVDVATP